LGILRLHLQGTTPEEFPTAPVKTQLRQLPKPASNLSFAKFDFDDEEELL
jgi:hypothetical protein